MRMPKDRFSDRVEHLEGFIAMKSAVTLIAIEAGVNMKPNAAKALAELDKLLAAMIARLKEDVK